MLVMPSGDAWAPGEYGAAVSENPAQEVSPASNAAFERGRSLLAMGQSEEAMVHLRSAIESEPDHVEAHYRLGLAAYQAGDMDTLREQAEILRGLNRSYASMLSNLH
jgi:Flp pilus assembly protein TadD